MNIILHTSTAVGTSGSLTLGSPLTLLGVKVGFTPTEEQACQILQPVKSYGCLPVLKNSVRLTFCN